MTYFNSDYISNSDLKKVNKYWNGGLPEPDNLQEIFDDGTCIHETLLEHHKADKSLDIYPIAVEMAKTVRKDSLCGSLLRMHDFKVEHEFYRQNVHGVNGRCKMDGSSKAMSVIFEYKGLGVTTEKAFHEAIMRFDYDQGAAWYLDVTGYRRLIIGGASKKDPKKLFKVLIDRDHHYYKSGLIKVQKSISILKQLIGV